MRWLALKIGQVYRFYNQPTAKFHTEVLAAKHSLVKPEKFFDSPYKQITKYTPSFFLIGY